MLADQEQRGGALFLAPVAATREPELVADLDVVLALERLLEQRDRLVDVALVEQRGRAKADVAGLLLKRGVDLVEQLERLFGVTVEVIEPDLSEQHQRLAAGLDGQILAREQPPEHALGRVELVEIGEQLARVEVDPRVARAGVDGLLEQHRGVVDLALGPGDQALQMEVTRIVDRDPSLLDRLEAGRGLLGLPIL